MSLYIFLLCALYLVPSHAFVYTFPDCTTEPLKSNAVTRAAAVIKLFTVQELMSNTVNLSPGVPRLGLPSYQWWSEALHGVAESPGVTFAASGNFSSATSFPQPILLATEARAFNNFGRAGIDFFTPNINPFKDPRWGRGQETPGEDPFHISQYVLNSGRLGFRAVSIPNPTSRLSRTANIMLRTISKTWEGNIRTSFDAQVTLQDLSEYYLPPFQSCVRDAKVASVMCSYNSVNGVPSVRQFISASKPILRDFWGFDDDRWVTTHHFTSTYPEAVADALKAGTDLDCGTAYSLHLPDAFNQSLITRGDLEKALLRQYTSLVRLGYFDPPSIQPYRQLSWANVNLPDAQKLAYQAALEGIVLLKNDGTLPLKSTVKKLAVIGPWANATTQMQGNYQGVAPFLVSPFQGAINAGYQATFVAGTTISGTSTAGFAAAVAAAQAADAVIFAGGIDGITENEGHDRTTIVWPGNQLTLISALEATGKPVVVLQFGGGQVDGSALKRNRTVNAMLWAGYPGQSGGTALFDIISGKASPAGRLSITQYPAAYTSQVGMTDMKVRPSDTNPGRTYRWYRDTPVFEFGHGLHFTTFALNWQRTPSTRYDISQLIVSASSGRPLDLATFDTFDLNVKNTGKVASDYVALLFINGTAGPAPHPNKQLISYTRLHQIKAGSTGRASLAVTLGSIARADTSGNLWLYSGSYQLNVDTGPVLLTHRFDLVGNSAQITHWPQPQNASA
ncbi:glycoside hydrolase family 3 protein [Lyophyllum atratum]|nr:glycoside hydrolase family 3 protein [Lyophyllum atratum]